MCGRISAGYDWRELHELLSLSFPQFEDPGPRFNVAPSQMVPVFQYQDEYRLVPMEWGLIPSWARDKPDSARSTGLINARAETAATKPTFGHAMKHGRCLIPVTGFYEWARTGSGKQPYHFHESGGGIFTLAGLFEPAPETDALPTFAIVTVPANETVAPIHDRMPAIITPANMNRWLRGGETVQDLLVPAPPGLLVADRVSKRVNSPSVDDASLIEPVEDQIDPGLFGQ